MPSSGSFTPLRGRAVLVHRRGERAVYLVTLQSYPTPRGSWLRLIQRAGASAVPTMRVSAVRAKEPEGELAAVVAFVSPRRSPVVAYWRCDSNRSHLAADGTRRVGVVGTAVRRLVVLLGVTRVEPFDP